MADAAVALQNEDRIQQRLCDLAAALKLLERVLAGELVHSDTDLSQAIIASLRLEETRQAFAASIERAEHLHQPSTVAKAPSLGDVDLF